jgi:DNA-binding transcriptional ArsR family regulator
VDRAVLELQARLCRVLGHPLRLEVLYILGEEGEVAAGDLVRRLGVTPANLSQHVARMRDAGVVAVRRRRGAAYYRLALPEALAACEAVGRALERRAELDVSALGRTRRRRGV